MQHLNVFMQENDKELLKNYVQLIPLTPDTSFRMTSGSGTVEERALMFAVLRHVPELKGYLKELEALIEEAQAEAETLRDAIKAEMLNRGTEELEAGQYIIRWTSVLSNRFDTTGFKKAYGELYKAFTKPSASMRFTFA